MSWQEPSTPFVQSVPAAGLATTHQRYISPVVRDPVRKRLVDPGSRTPSYEPSQASQTPRRRRGSQQHLTPKANGGTPRSTPVRREARRPEPTRNYARPWAEDMSKYLRPKEPKDSPRKRHDHWRPPTTKAELEAHAARMKQKPPVPAVHYELSGRSSVRSSRPLSRSSVLTHDGRGPRTPSRGTPSRHAHHRGHAHHLPQHQPHPHTPQRQRHAGAATPGSARQRRAAQPDTAGAAATHRTGPEQPQPQAEAKKNRLSVFERLSTPRFFPKTYRARRRSQSTEASAASSQTSSRASATRRPQPRRVQQAWGEPSSPSGSQPHLVGHGERGQEHQQQPDEGAASPALPRPESVQSTQRHKKPSVFERLTNPKLFPASHYTKYKLRQRRREEVKAKTEWTDPLAVGEGEFHVGPALGIPETVEDGNKHRSRGASTVSGGRSGGSSRQERAERHNDHKSARETEEEEEEEAAAAAAEAKKKSPRRGFGRFRSPFRRNTRREQPPAPQPQRRAHAVAAPDGGGGAAAPARGNSNNRARKLPQQPSRSSSSSSAAAAAAAGGGGHASRAPPPPAEQTAATEAGGTAARGHGGPVRSSVVSQETRQRSLPVPGGEVELDEPVMEPDMLDAKHIHVHRSAAASSTAALKDRSSASSSTHSMANTRPLSSSSIADVNRSRFEERMAKEKSLREQRMRRKQQQQQQTPHGHEHEHDQHNATTRRRAAEQRAHEDVDQTLGRGLGARPASTHTPTRGAARGGAPAQSSARKQRTAVAGSAAAPAAQTPSSERKLFAFRAVQEARERAARIRNEQQEEGATPASSSSPTGTRGAGSAAQDADSGFRPLDGDEDAVEEHTGSGPSATPSSAAKYLMKGGRYTGAPVPGPHYDDTDDGESVGTGGGGGGGASDLEFDLDEDAEGGEQEHHEDDGVGAALDASQRLKAAMLRNGAQQQSQDIVAAARREARRRSGAYDSADESEEEDETPPYASTGDGSQKQRGEQDATAAVDVKQGTTTTTTITTDGAEPSSGSGSGASAADRMAALEAEAREKATRVMEVREQQRREEEERRRQEEEKRREEQRVAEEKAAAEREAARRRAEEMERKAQEDAERVQRELEEAQRREEERQAAQRAKEEEERQARLKAQREEEERRKAEEARLAAEREADRLAREEEEAQRRAKEEEAQKLRELEEARERAEQERRDMEEHARAEAARQTAAAVAEARRRSGLNQDQTQTEAVEEAGKREGHEIRETRDVTTDTQGRKEQEVQKKEEGEGGIGESRSVTDALAAARARRERRSAALSTSTSREQQQQQRQPTKEEEVEDEGRETGEAPPSPEKSASTEAEGAPNTEDAEERAHRMTVPTTPPPTLPKTEGGDNDKEEEEEEGDDTDRFLQQPPAQQPQQSKSMLSPRMPRASIGKADTANEAQSKVDRLLAEARRRRESRQSQGNMAAATAAAAEATAPAPAKTGAARPAAETVSPPVAGRSPSAERRIETLLADARRQRRTSKHAGNGGSSTHTINMVKGEGGLGMVIEDARSDETQYNIRVKSLRENGAAHSAGLQIGDRLILVNGNNARGKPKKEMINFFKQLPQNAAVKLVILRGVQ